MSGKQVPNVKEIPQQKVFLGCIQGKVLRSLYRTYCLESFSVYLHFLMLSSVQLPNSNSASVLPAALLSDAVLLRYAFSLNPAAACSRSG